jgi:hypothetical protein
MINAVLTIKNNLGCDVYVFGKMIKAMQRGLRELDYFKSQNMPVQIRLNGILFFDFGGKENA